MKNLLYMIVSLFIGQNLLAQEISDINIENIKMFKKDKQINNGFEPCKKMSCSISSDKTLDYLSPMTSNGKVLKNIEQEKVNVDVKIITEKEKKALEIIYTENTKNGLFYENNTMAISHEISKKTNYNAVYYIPINNKDKTYKVTVKDKIDVVVKLK